jgi:arylsulfatase A-like enzyme
MGRRPPKHRPNIDRIIVDSAVSIDGYALTSCMAERAAFSTGHMPLRTGLTTVGIPASRRAPDLKSGRRPLARGRGRQMALDSSTLGQAERKHHG